MENYSRGKFSFERWKRWTLQIPFPVASFAPTGCFTAETPNMIFATLPTCELLRLAKPHMQCSMD
jgi:hypothetical protein